MCVHIVAQCMNMTKDEKIAVAIQILKNIGDDEKKQMSLFQEVASDEH